MGGVKLRMSDGLQGGFDGLGLSALSLWSSEAGGCGTRCTLSLSLWAEKAVGGDAYTTHKGWICSGK